ncbi:RNA-binding ribosome biosynthesis protein mak21 [Rhinocladiella similis]
MSKNFPVVDGGVIASSTAETSKATNEVPNGPFEHLRNKIESRLQSTEQKKGKDKFKRKTTSSDHERRKKNTDLTSPDRGKKRDRNGKVLNHDEAPKDLQKVDGSNDDNDVLLKEIRELGGTAEDLELLEGAESDSEVEDTAADKRQKTSTSSAAPEGLEKGINNILKEIALAQGQRDNDGSEDNVEVEEPVEAAKPGVLANGQIPPANNEKTAKNTKGKQPQYLFAPKPDWYNVPEPVVETEQSLKYTLSQDTIRELHDFAKSLLDEENQKYKNSQQSSSAQSFYNTVIASGTLSDKISALTLAVQESPVHNMRPLEILIGLAGKRSRSQAVEVLRALKDLFAQGSLLPESRKLYAFHSQPTLPYLFGQLRSWRRGNRLPRGLDEATLIIWAFESWLKEQYFEVLKILEVWCNDEIEFSKGRAVSYVYELLKERPEQESNLLRLLINKLGDPIKKIASQASYLLMQLLIAHPAMKGVAIAAVEGDFVFRPGQSMHGKYYAVVTLNQTALSSKEEDVARKLLDIYFGLFAALLKTVKVETNSKPEENDQHRGRGKKQKKPQISGQAQTEELREKLISAILTGVNRAYPYVGADGTSFTEHMETLFKITHSSNFNTSVQAMMLIQQLSATHKASNDRFYRILYESLLDPRLIASSKQQLYLNLLHRSLKADLNVKRVKAFVKRIVQILSLHEPSFICGAFFLIQDLEATFPSLTGLVDQAEDHDDDEEFFRDVDEDGDQAAVVLPEKSQGILYDGHKRAPEHSNADNSCLWEVLPFLAHFHPSVSVSADHLLRHTKLPGKPDLNLHTLSHFLDRFVYRNPKLSSAGLRGSSIMQPMANDTSNVLIGSTLSAARKLPLNSVEFKTKKQEDVAAEDIFFHQYFSSLGSAGSNKAKAQKKSRDEDDGSVDEDEVWKAMMESAPDLEGAEEGDDDLDMSEVDSELMASSEGEVDDDDNNDDDDVDLDPALFDEDDDDLVQMPREEDDEPADEGASDFEGFGEDLTSSKDKRKEDKEKAKKSKKAKNLPTFASAADYAKMLDDDEDEDLGV